MCEHCLEMSQKHIYRRDYIMFFKGYKNASENIHQNKKTILVSLILIYSDFNKIVKSVLKVYTLQ